MLLLSHSVMSNSLQPHGLQHTRLPCPSPHPRACSDSHPWRVPKNRVTVAYIPQHIFPSWKTECFPSVKPLSSPRKQSPHQISPILSNRPLCARNYWVEERRGKVFLVNLSIQNRLKVRKGLRNNHLHFCGSI